MALEPSGNVSACVSVGVTERKTVNEWMRKLEEVDELWSIETFLVLYSQNVFISPRCSFIQHFSIEFHSFVASRTRSRSSLQTNKIKTLW